MTRWWSRARSPNTLALGWGRCSRGQAGIEAEVTLETAPPVVFDAVVLPSGKAAIERC